MSHRIVQIHVKKDKPRLFDELLKDPLIIDSWRLEEDKNRLSFSLLVRTQDTQRITDKVQNFLGIGDGKEYIGVNNDNSATRIIITPVEAVFPRPEETTIAVDRKSKFSATISREELYDDISKGAELNRTFFLLTIFSTIVAAIGLLEDNVAVVIGAMVIAPLLGPNLALALAAALGDIKLMIKAVKANLAGLGTALLLSFALGIVWAGPLDSPELLARTEVGLDGIVLAIVSGAAAVLSLVTGVSSVLVGVMVAVALLPPAAALGIMAGAGEFSMAWGAFLLLAVNVVCVNLSAKLVFLFKGIGPRTWYEKKRAQKAMQWYLIFWGIALLILGGIIVFRGGIGG